MSNVRDTSKESFFGEILPQMNRKHGEVIRAFLHKGEPMTNAELAAFMQRPINTVTPRVYELRGLSKHFAFDTPLVRKWGTRKCGITGRTAIVWELNFDKQLSLL